MMAMARLIPVLALALAAAGSSGAATRFVDPGHPHASDDADGSADRPYRTLARALARLKPGDTLTIAGGVYREPIIFPDIDWAGGPTVVQGAAAGEVVVKGSDLVTGWEPLGGGLYVKRPWTVNSQQVFVDGRPLKQIGGTILNGYPLKPGHPLAKLHASQKGIWPGRVPGGVAEMTEDSFHYDAATRSLYVKSSLDSLEGHAVEVSVRPYLLLGKRLRDVTVRDIRFQHANTTAIAQSGAVTVTGARLVLERLEVTLVDGSGFDVTGDDIVLAASRANRCGQIGMKVRGRRNRIVGNETSFNNTRGFNKWWEAGGAKFVGAGGLKDSVVTRHRALANDGDGIWFDWMNGNNRVFRNVAAYNAGFGIHYEASQRGYIHDNFVFANRQRGIYLPHSSGSVVAHNLVAHNGLEGIAIVDEGRSKGREALRPRSNLVFGNILAWNAKAAVVLPRDMRDNASDYNLFVSAGEPPRFSAGWGSRESPVRTGLGAWRAATGQDVHSWHVRAETPPAVREALRERRRDPDWGTVFALASEYGVPPPAATGAARPDDAASAAPPGPRP